MILESLVIPVGFDTGLLFEGLSLIKSGLDSVGDFLADSTKEAIAAQDIQAQLDAVLKSTGGSAGVTADMVNNLASKFQGLTKFEDDAIVSGENMLLTFTSIGKEVFPRATETILDMSQALGQDLKGSAIQLGKALNDPISGITALRRVGVQFTDAQEDTIKKLVESGNLLQAQTLILDELQKEFGGSAVAAGKTFGGQLEILKNKLGDVQERIGGALLPLLGALTERFGKIVDSPAFNTLIDTVVSKLGEVGDWIITNLPVWEEKFTKWLTNISVWWNETAKPALADMRDWLENNVKPVVEDVTRSWEHSADSWNAHVVPVLNELGRLWNNIITLLGKVFPFLDTTNEKFTLLGIVQRIAVGWATLVNIQLALLQQSLSILNGMLERAIQRWDSWKRTILEVVAALSQLAIPWWLTPGSPTPLENGLRGIGDAMKDITNNGLLPKLVVSNNQSTPASSNAFDYGRFGLVVEHAIGRATG